MNASNAFRSNLMQQFAASARSQARPPLALIGWLAEQDESGSVGTRRDRTLSSTSLHTRNISSIQTSSLSPPSAPPSRHAVNSSLSLSRSSHLNPVTRRQASSSAGVENDCESLELSELLQGLLRTRRTRNHFAPLDDQLPAEFWKDALERAVVSGCAAPNHRRTEPFTFKRMIAPSPVTKRLADIAYHVQLDKLTRKDMDDQARLCGAERKRGRWSQIPAFLVTTVTSEEPVLDLDDLAEDSPYDILPYAPPQSERELEDYASACAAVQNALLSLHAEDLASKWVTGDVVKTPAFRELVQATPYERIVALIMVGQPDETKNLHRRRRRREIHCDVLVDL